HRGARRERRADASTGGEARCRLPRVGRGAHRLLADARVAEPDRADRAGGDQRLLELEGGRTPEPAVEVRTPPEVALLVARVDLLPQRLVGVEVAVPRVPCMEVRGPLRLPAGGDEQAVLRLVPVDRLVVHVVPGELVEHEPWGQSGELVE